jgi:hypothetical protein
MPLAIAMNSAGFLEVEITPGENRDDHQQDQGSRPERHGPGQR